MKPMSYREVTKLVEYLIYHSAFRVKFSFFWSPLWVSCSLHVGNILSNFDVKLGYTVVCCAEYVTPKLNKVFIVLYY